MRCVECGGRGGFMSWADNADVEMCDRCGGTGREPTRRLHNVAELKGKTKNIGYSVAYNNAIRLIAAGTVELDTEDIGAEVAELADVLWEHLKDRLDQEKAGGGGGGNARGGARTSSKRSGTSSKRGSSRSGSRSSGGGGSDRPPSEKQLDYFMDLVLGRDHGLDFEQDGEDVSTIEGKKVSKLSGKEVSEYIEDLKEEPQL